MLNTQVATPAAGPSAPASTEPSCRLCGARLHHTLIDFGSLPLAYRTIPTGSTDDQPYPLHARICDNCSLVQVEAVAEPKAITAPCLSSDFAIGRNEAKRCFESMRKRLRLDAGSLVIEVGCNDPTLLRKFQADGIRVLGIESPANGATAIGPEFPTEIGPFNAETAMQIAVRHGCADLVIANNVLPQTRDLFDLAAGLACILRPNGILTLQMPHLLSMLEKSQFDAFRHDCYSYLSLRVLEHVLRSVGLRVFDAERLSDLGGSLRVQACHVVAPHAARPALKAVRLAEGSSSDISRQDLYTGFSDRVAAVQDDIRDFLQNRRSAGRRVVGYGAAVRGAMLLNCCGITRQEIATIADPDPARHGRLLPGSRIPIVPLEALMADPPDDVVILPWPSVTEIMLKLMPLRQFGTQFWTLIPHIARV
jgi:hypothetical protein